MLQNDDARSDFDAATDVRRGEGGVLRNREGRRFMFDDVPENYRSQTADSAIGERSL